VADTGSTNDDMLARAAAGEPEGLWIRAERQTRGRGRHGRSWTSAGGNLHASTLIRVRPGEPEPATLALVAAVALEETISAWLPPGIAVLKWPNDLLVNGAKLSGILLERSGDAVVAGFGANLTASPPDIDRPATSITALLGTAPDPADVLAALAEAFARWLARWRQDGLEPIRARWLACAHPLGTPLSVRAGDGPAEEGLFDGLDRTGALLLRTAEGLRTIRAGDVFLL
jgi:BirA family biotin operon repressor/biotin-[acetyl-CoA-carboxylase] ligase